MTWDTLDDVRTASDRFVVRDRERGSPLPFVFPVLVGAWSVGLGVQVVVSVVRGEPGGSPTALVDSSVMVVVTGALAVLGWRWIRLRVWPGPPLLKMDAHGVHRTTPVPFRTLFDHESTTFTLPWKEVAEVGVRILDHTDDARPGPDAGELLARVRRFGDWNRSFVPRRRSDPGPPRREAAGRVVLTVRVVPGARTRRHAYLHRMGDVGRHRATAAPHGKAAAIAELDALRRAVSAWERGLAGDGSGAQLAWCCVLPADDVDVRALHETVRRHTGAPARELGRLGPGDLDNPLRVADALADAAEEYAGRVGPSGG